MSLFKCNNCKQVYPDPKPDGTAAFHVCYPEVVVHAVRDDAGNVITPETRTPRENIRNENYRPDIVYLNGEPHSKTPHPEERGQFIYTPCEFGIIAEGLGRTVIDDGSTVTI